MTVLDGLYECDRCQAEVQIAITDDGLVLVDAHGRCPITIHGLEETT